MSDFGFENSGEFQGAIITDCADPNAEGRQRARFHSLFGVVPNFIGLYDEDPAINGIEAAGQLVDELDAARTPGNFPSRPLVALVNVAPRGDDVSERWQNGTPFCYFPIENDGFVLSTFDGQALSLARDLGIAEEVELLDIPTVTQLWVQEEILLPAEAKKINETQFRSLEFLPLAARWLADGRNLPSETRSLENHPDIDGLAWDIDSFGNIKTTVRPEQIEFTEGNSVPIGDHEAVCYEHLRSVPTGQLALTHGSSGYGATRLLELVISRGRAADELGLKIGSRVIDLAQYKSQRIAA